MWLKDAEGDLDRPFNDMRYFLDLRQLETLGWKERWGCLAEFAPSN